MPYEWAPAPPEINIPRYDFSGFTQAASDITDAVRQHRTNTAISQLMQAKTPDEQSSAIANLMRFDPKTALAYTTYLKSQQLTPGERQAHEDRQAALYARYPGLDPANQGGQGPAQPQMIGPTGSPNVVPTAPDTTTVRPPVPHQFPRNEDERRDNEEARKSFYTQQNEEVKSRIALRNKMGTPDQQRQRYFVNTRGLDSTIDTIDKILAYDKTDSPIPSWMGGGSMLDAGTGFWGSAGKIPGTTGFDLKRLQTQLQSQAKLAGFQDLRDASINGSSGFARTAVVEFNAIGDKVAALDPNQSKEAYIENLRKFRDWAVAAKDGLARPPGFSPKDTSIQRETPSPSETPDTSTLPQTGGATVAGGIPKVGKPSSFKTDLNPTGAPPSDKVIFNLVQHGHDPEARRIFDTYYGKGASDWILQGGG